MREPELSFVLNDETVRLHDVSPTDTLLDFIRLEKRLTGTKEGCAEGDCGACTVLVGRAHADMVTYQPMNACIALMPMLQGAHVLTIEALAQGDALHPIQTALHTHHGSQCGFCTPGIVMALYAAWLNGALGNSAATKTALQGNLCRCTGYAPILRAAADLKAAPADDPRQQEAREMAKRLAALPDPRGTAALSIPKTVDELSALLAKTPETRLVAGATDVGLWVTKDMADIAPAAFINQLQELDFVAFKGPSVSIGANTSYAKLLTSLAPKLPQMTTLLHRIGGAQVRAMGTLGGNIANGSPIGDLPPALIALGAQLRLASAAGTRDIPLEDFFIAYGQQDLRPGEFVHSLTFDLPRATTHAAFYKLSKRKDEDISSVSAGFAIEMGAGRITGARLAFGGMAGTPKRASRAEAALIGQSFDETAIEAARIALTSDFTPLSDVRASAEYRMKAAQNMLTRLLAEAQT